MVNMNKIGISKLPFFLSSYSILAIVHEQSRKIFNMLQVCIQASRDIKLLLHGHLGHVPRAVTRWRCVVLSRCALGICRDNSILN